MNEHEYAYAEAIEGGYDVANYAEPMTPQVVPVEVVSPVPVEARPTRAWTTGQLSWGAGDTLVRQLVGAHPTRVRLVLLVIDGAAYVGPSEASTAETNGMFVFSGLPFEFTTRHEIYIKPSGTDPVRVSWYAEFLDG